MPYINFVYFSVPIEKVCLELYLTLTCNGINECNIVYVPPIGHSLPYWNPSFDEFDSYLTCCGVNDLEQQVSRIKCAYRHSA